MVQVTYQKNDGCIFQRERATMLPYKVGDTTSMGWKVLNIEYLYKDKYYPLYKYNILTEKDKQSRLKKQKIKTSFIRESKTILYCFSTVVFINFLKIFFGI